MDIAFGNTNKDQNPLATALTESDGLTDQQRLFKDAYLRCWNATEAARRAGYACPAQAGWRLLRNVEISRQIEIELKAHHIGTNHVLARLGEMANINLNDFLDEGGRVDLEKLRSKGHLVKKYKAKVNRKLSTDEVEVSDVEIELHDAQHALELVGRKCKMFGPDVQLNVQIVAFQQIYQDLMPLIKEVIDPAKMETWRQGLAELARKYGACRETKPLSMGTPGAMGS